jgi:hypothetical protein
MNSKALLLLSFLLCLQASIVSAAEIIVKGADAVWKADQQYLPELRTVTTGVLPRISVEHASSALKLENTAIPAELSSKAAEVKLRLLVEHASSISRLDNTAIPAELTSKVAEVKSRLIVEHASSVSKLDNTAIPAELVNKTAMVQPRIIVEHATSALSIDLVPFPPGLVTKQMEVQALPDKLIADGSQTAQIIVSLKDEFGNPVIDETVVVTATLGNISTVKNNKDGTYSATYTAGKEAGEVTITAKATNAGISKSTKITLISGVISEELAFKLSLDSGLNMISLPLDPDIDFTARTFAENLGATTVTSFDTTEDKFIPFVPEVFSGDGFSIEGGQGYIVNVLEKKDVVFTGTGWSNTPLEAAAPPLDKPTWAFIVAGTVFDEDGELLKDASVYSVVEVLRNHKKITCLVGQVESGKFATALVDMDRKAVVFADEPLKIYVQDAAGNVVSGPITHRISVEEITRGYAKFNMRLGDVIPEKSVLLQNYPNPFNPETWIPFQLAKGSDVVISIFNLQGQMIRRLDIGHRQAGLYLSKGRAAYWDGQNETGEQVASGVYFYTIDAGGFRATRRMVIIR